MHAEVPTIPPVINVDAELDHWRRQHADGALPHNSFGSYVPWIKFACDSLITQPRASNAQRDEMFQTQYALQIMPRLNQPGAPAGRSAPARLSCTAPAQGTADHPRHLSGTTTMKAGNLFNTIAKKAAAATGSPWTFLAAVAIVVIWGISGPMFGFNDTWQLVINTGTTIVTFLMVFLIQQSQNKDGQALHLKLDELLIALKGADEGLVDAEQLDEDKLLALAAACTARARLAARSDRRKGREERVPGKRHRTVRGSLRVRRKALRAG
ncbi:hypothetical protein G6F57_012728 [Rhizopus arrhizus]|nr:hypothetical protein G6F57_012728 [Rhizopus arrhizus]